MADEKSILDLIDTTQLSCLNENSSHTVKDILGRKTVNSAAGSYLLSDADEQLLLTITFNQSVRIRKLAIRSSEDPSKAPKSIKLLINRPSIGFEDTTDAVQELELTEDQVKEGKSVALRYVRFQSVNTLHIFIENNHGDEDETRIDAVDIIGTPFETTKDLSGLRQEED
ncbi:PITH domain-containing protein [Pterulicium gracile]|uniref:PITH domain-containing protein n=1 Tax=Pterulicium gracile TaxID=1884261 RepID=A0A5C3QY34_9AGAR|nr:PITH domain-containing protein [Pterula gracilis]